MRVTIGLDQFTPAQWAWLDQNMPQTREFGLNSIRMCVTIGEDRHIEMAPREFVAMLGQLNLIETTGTVGRDIEVIIAAVFDRHTAPEPVAGEATCEHGQPLMSKQPSFVFGADPVRVFTDGCRSYGKYPRFDW